MKKMAKAAVVVLTMAIAGGAAAGAQQPGAGNVIKLPGVELQAGAMVNVAQVKDDLFAGTEKFAKGASDVTEINLDPSMMGMVAGKSGMTPASPSAQMARRMKFMVIHTYEYPKAGMYNDEDVEAYRKKLQDGTWSCSIHVKDKDGTTDICSRTSPDHEGAEMVIMTAEPKELTFIHMSGNMSLKDLSRMGGTMGGGNVLNRRIPPTPPPPPPPPAPAATVPSAPK